MPGSVLGTVKTRRLVEEAEEEEEEYDPLNPAVGNVASVVKVSARRSATDFYTFQFLVLQRHSAKSQIDELNS